MFYKEIHEMKLRVIIMFIVLLVSLVTTVALRPYAAQMMEEMTAQLEEMPDFLKSLMGDVSGLTRLNDDNYYLLSQWHGKNYGQFLPFVVLLIAFPIFAKEFDKKTIYFLLSRKNRNEVFRTKYLAGLGALLIITTVLSLLGPIAMNLAGYSTAFGDTLKVLLQQLVGASFFYSLFTMISIMSRDQVKPVVAGILIVLGLPILGMIDALSWLNPYPFILGSSVAQKGTIDWIYLVSLLA
ncbi:ABC transporter permease subunit, partial [Mesotoga prima]|uniref:ABC transporter permease n=1 Tax=Mesotoga prima TaxID=1184387 RepID=UPI002B9E36BB